MRDKRDADPLLPVIPTFYVWRAMTTTSGASRASLASDIPIG
jgi:hypothetical protein